MTSYASFDELPCDYDVLLADPPWAYTGSPTKDQAAGKHYACMSVDELAKAFPVGAFMAKRAVLFLWATSPKVDDAMDLIRKWGLHFRGVAFVWTKTNSRGEPVGAQGVRPSIVKPVTEFVFAASNVRSGRPLPLSSEKIRQAVLAPRGRHSEKPDQVQRRIEWMYPGVRRLEMFARTKRVGWDAFGNDPALFTGPDPSDRVFDVATKVTSLSYGWTGLVVHSWDGPHSHVTKVRVSDRRQTQEYVVPTISLEEAY